MTCSIFLGAIFIPLTNYYAQSTDDFKRLEFQNEVDRCHNNEGHVDYVANDLDSGWIYFCNNSTYIINNTF